jgi:hypothetical protein
MANDGLKSQGNWSAEATTPLRTGGTVVSTVGSALMVLVVYLARHYHTPTLPDNHSLKTNWPQCLE